MSDYSFKRENVSEFWHIIECLAELHWKETGMLDIPLDIDKGFYSYVDQEKWHLGYGIYYKNELIGYLSVMKTYSPANKSTSIAMTDGFFIKKEFRTAGSYKILKEVFAQAELDLKRDLGVDYLVLMTHANNPLYKLADKLGFSSSGIQFVKRI